MKWLPILLIFALASSAAAEAPVTARLVLEAVPSGCAGAQEITQQVDGLLGREAFTHHAHADLRVELRLRATHAGHVASLRLVRRDGAQIGTREIVSPSSDCSALTRPLALVLALMIDLPRPDVRIQLPVPEPAPEASSTSPEAVRRSARVLPVEGTASPLGLELGLSAFITGGLLSPWAYGTRPALRAVVSPLFSLEAAFRWLPRREIQRDELRVSTRGYLLEMAPCLSFGGRSVRGSVCASIGVGNTRASGENFDDNRRVDSPLVEAGLRADLSVPLHDALALRFGAGAGVGIIRQNLVYETSSGAPVTFFSPWPVRPFALLEIAWTPRFGRR